MPLPASKKKLASALACVAEVQANRARYDDEGRLQKAQTGAVRAFES